MSRRHLLAAVSLALALTAAAQQTPPVQLTAAEDHQRLMDLLGITELRPGVSPTPNRPNTANYDESKANPYPNLPDLLLLNNGKKVTTAKIWWTKRRPELVEIFDREIFGRVPANAPKVTWQVISIDHETQANIPVITKYLIGHVDNSSYPLITVDIRLTLTTPANAPGPVPVILEFTFENYPQPPRRDGTPQPPMPADPTAQWKQDLIRKGWGYALLEPTSIQADNGAGLTQGIIGLCNHGQPRKLDDWGALRAWAWGGSRALDYLATDKSVDAKQVGVEGHSRFGKTALVAMAYDQRFAIAYISSSGAGGANLARRHFGEQIENTAGTGAYHWMAGNYIKYAALTPKEITANDLPVDTHELIALCAPRPVFIGGGIIEGDGWADVHGTFLAEAAAGPVYKLLGAKDLGTTTYPPIETPLITGDLAFRQHSGGHTPAPNWPTFITFASRYLKAPTPHENTGAL
jgi:hypothetical protein